MPERRRDARSSGSPQEEERNRAVVDRYLLPLRAFLGVTFVYAGLQKLADPNFFSAASSSSIQAQLRASEHSSPIGGLLGPFSHAAVLLGVIIALAEVLIGTGTLLGLWSRAAAVGGIALSIGFLLTVSWHSDPYYYGPDIVFVFAWTALLGPPGRWTLDRAIADRARESAANRGAAIDPGRRELLARSRIATVIAVPVLLGAGTVAALGRLFKSDAPRQGTVALRPSNASAGKGATAPGTATTAPSTTGAATSTSTTDPSTTSAASSAPPTTAPSGVAVGPVSAVPVGGAATFSDPATGDPAYVVQHRPGDLKAFSAVCTHNGCTVEYSRGSNTFECPCHGAQFDASTGAVLQGPARRPLPSIPVAVHSGQLYVDT